jgi:hypothetical protein
LKSAILASEEALRRFGYDGHNDKADAFRHCYWSALLARKIGAKYAEYYTCAHEDFPNNPHEEKAMDLHNNSIGISIGRLGGDDRQLSERCMAALLNNKLKTLK